MKRSFAILVSLLLAAPLAAEDRVRFSRDVLPILSENCFACHGPDESQRKADLRLDTREGALAVLSLEKPAESELLKRVLATDADIVMPPPASHKKRLTARQVETLRRWVEAGAPWGKHWAFERPVQVDPPKIAAHPIDAFVRARLVEEGLTPSALAPRHTLARRVSFDLTGLPPSTSELDEFLRDGDAESRDGAASSNPKRERGRTAQDATDRGLAERSPSLTLRVSEEAAYERLVDCLLASEHFGERLAMWWLDAARYADTDGFQGDATRTNWPWRDWVVGAFNRNLPFDQFTIEQFAGDLLPNATPEQEPERWTPLRRLPAP